MRRKLKIGDTIYSKKKFSSLNVFENETFNEFKGIIFEAKKDYFFCYNFNFIFGGFYSERKMYITKLVLTEKISKNFKNIENGI